MPTTIVSVSDTTHDAIPQTGQYSTIYLLVKRRLSVAAGIPGKTVDVRTADRVAGDIDDNVLDKKQEQLMGQCARQINSRVLHHA